MVVKLSRDKFMEIVKHTPLVAVDLIVRNPRAEVLLGLRTNEPARGFWFVPGGRIYKGERIKEAFQRVAHEELGIDLECENARFVGVFEHLYDENFAGSSGFGTHYIVLAYEVSDVEPLSELPMAQHSRYRWMDVAGLLGAEDVHQNTKAYFQ